MRRPILIVELEPPRRLLLESKFMTNTKTGSKRFVSKVTGRFTRSLALLASAGSPVMAADAPANVAVVATPVHFYHSGDTTVTALNDGNSPGEFVRAQDRVCMATGRAPARNGWQYEWTQPIATKQIEVYWWMDGQGVGAPKSCRLLYWNGTGVCAGGECEGLRRRPRYVQRHHLRRSEDCEAAPGIVSDGTLSTGVLEWRVLDSAVHRRFADGGGGIDRVVILAARLIWQAR